MTSREIGFGFLFVQCFIIPLATAETFEERHARDFVGNPSDLSFRLSTVRTEGRFHRGERIQIALEFSSSSIEKYKLNGATYDRSGRLPTEEFVIDRTDVADPYQDYFGIGVLGGLGGGLRGYPVLDSKPYTIELELNDWFRFDRTGVYRLYLKSHRLTRARVPGEGGENTVQFAAVSNILEIEILADDPSWSAAKLAEISGILGQAEPVLPKPGDPPVPYDPLSEKMAVAVRELRYLASNGAVQYMFDRARNDSARLDTLLLFGARDRAYLVAAFDSYLADPNVGMREWVIRLRAVFTLLEKDKPQLVPMLAWQIPDPAAWENIRQMVEGRQKRLEELAHAEAVRLIPITMRKTGAAKKTSAEAIAALAPSEARAAALVPPDDYGLTRDQLIAQFAQFAPEQQMELLTQKWDLVRGPEVIPVLRRMIDQAVGKPLPASVMALQVWGGDAVTDVALRRLDELSPNETASIVRKDLSVGKMRFAGFAVRSLPAQDFPEADRTFTDLLKDNLWGALPLVAKFGTARLAGQMRAIYDQGELWPCAEEESFTAYFVRVVPKDFGRDVLKRAMADREQRGCYRTLLSQIARVVWNPVVQEEAIARLNDPDPDAAVGAAAVLGSHGGPDVESALWKRLEQWSEKWKGRTEGFQANPITGASPNRSEEQLGVTLFQTIGSAKYWVIDEPRRNRLLSLCLDDWCRKSWASELFSGAVVVEVSNGGEAYPPAFRVQGYTARTFADLKTKLGHFSAGTTFRWCPQTFNPFDAYTPGEREEMYEDLSAFLSKRSMSIEPESAKCTGGVNQ